MFLGMSGEGSACLRETKHGWQTTADIAQRMGASQREAPMAARCGYQPVARPRPFRLTGLRLPARHSLIVADRSLSSHQSVDP
jgi:hypothetical protein